MSRNKNSALNSQAATRLVEGRTFTGSWEPCLEYSCIVIFLTSSSEDSIGHLVVQFSDDAGSTITSSTCLTVFREHLYKSIGCLVKGSHFRVVFHAARVQDTRAVAIANDFSALTISTILRCDTVPKNCDVDMTTQKIVVRGYQTFPGVSFSGLQQNIVANSSAGQTLDTAFLPTTNRVLRVLTSSTDNVDGTGDGARTFLVCGTDQNNRAVFWKGGFANGNTAVSVSSFTRVNYFCVLTCGSLGAPALASTMSVQIHNGSTYETLVTLADAHNFTYDNCFFTVPVGYTATAVDWVVTAASQTDSDTMFGLVRSGTIQPINLATNINNQATYQQLNGAIRAMPGDSFVAEVTADAAQWVAVKASIRLECAPGGVTFSNYM